MEKNLTERDLCHSILKSKLENVTFNKNAFNCRNINCDDESHRQESDEALNDLLVTVQEACKEASPISMNKQVKNKSSKRKTFYGWNEVKPFQESALFWNSVCISCGKPLNTEIHKVMKHARNIYHYQIRKFRKTEEKIKHNKLLDACINGNGDIFKEIKKMRKSKPTVANKIDDTSKDIPDHFAKIYKDLYNSVDDSKDLLEVSELINNKVNISSLNDVDLVTVEKVKKATMHLKRDKKTLAL